MKTSSIGIRIEESESTRIEAFANRTDRTVSDILRHAAACAISGDIPRAKERISCVAIRHTANNLLAIFDYSPSTLNALA